MTSEPRHLRQLEEITEEQLTERGIVKVGTYSSYMIYAQDESRYLLHDLNNGRYRVVFKYNSERMRPGGEVQ